MQPPEQVYAMVRHVQGTNGGNVTGRAQSKGVVGDADGFRQGRGLGQLASSGIPIALVTLACLVFGVACPGCGKGPARLRPVASLADSTLAGTAFERIRAAWVRNDPVERPVLRRELDRFVAAHPTDGLAPLARIYAILSLMDPPADWSDAERRLDALAPPPPGAAHDLYVVATAKLKRYHHQPEAAFGLLAPIVGHVVDTRARGLLQEELAFDALEAREPYEAIAYMDAWLRGASEEDRHTSEAKVAVALGAVPEAALRGSLETMRASARAGESHGYGLVIERLVAERLGRVAVDRGDAALARWLLDAEAGDARLGEEVSAALVQLATSRRGIGSVAGRTVGLVLPTSSAVLRDEVADVLRGVLWALDIGRNDRGRSESAIRLVTRDDGGDAERLRLGMEEVAGEGAAVIITALDADTAAEALAWAASSTISVIVLSTPSPSGAAAGAAPPSPGSGFSVGEDWNAEMAALVGGLVGSAALPLLTSSRVATLADSEANAGLRAATLARGGSWEPPLSCDLAPTSAGESRFPIAGWQRTGVERWLVAGSSSCADDLLTGLRRAGEHGVMALSLEASAAKERGASTIRLVTASTGIVPLSLASPSDPRVVDARAMVAQTGAADGWWTALGHDAATLARGALATLPPDTTADLAEIARRRARVQQGLIQAHAPLWTSELEGFDTSRTLPRTIRVVELGHTATTERQKADHP